MRHPTTIRTRLHPACPRRNAHEGARRGCLAGRGGVGGGTGVEEAGARAQQGREALPRWAARVLPRVSLPRVDTRHEPTRVQRGNGEGRCRWGGRERRVHCSYCLGRHTAQEECRAQETAPCLTLPRRSGPRTRKPKLPTPPCSPPVPRSCTSLHTSPGDCSLHCPGGSLSAVLSSEARSCSTPSPPPPPELGEGEEEFCQTGPLPPPPMDQLQPLECSTPPGQCSPTPLYGGKTPAATPKRVSSRELSLLHPHQYHASHVHHSNQFCSTLYSLRFLREGYN